MPTWLGAFLHDWGAVGGVVTFILGAVGALFWLFANGTIIFGYRLLQDRAAYEARIREVREDLADMTHERDRWMDIAIRGLEVGRISLSRMEIPPLVDEARP